MNEELSNEALPCSMMLQVQRLYDGELPDEQVAVVQGHLKECAVCQEFHRSFENVSAELNTLPLPGHDWRIAMTRRLVNEQAGDFRFVRRLTGIAAVLVAGLSTLAFTLTSSNVEQQSPFAAIDQWSKYSSTTEHELASVMVQELSESNQ
jgi:anti-sigma factor RsiW